MRYSIQELLSLSKEYSKSKQVTPRQYYGKPEEIFPLIHHGDLLGFTPMEALNSFLIINGKMTMWGDALPALALNSGELEKFDESFKGSLDDGTLVAICSIKRKGISTVKTTEFSLEDAKKAGLWSPPPGRSKGQWATYPKRMLQIRARSFALRNTFADKLGGIIAAEEALDYNGNGNGKKKTTETVKDPETKKVPEKPKEPPKLETSDREISDCLDSMGFYSRLKEKLEEDGDAPSFDRAKVDSFFSDLVMSAEDQDAPLKQKLMPLVTRAILNPKKLLEVVKTYKG